MSETIYYKFKEPETFSLTNYEIAAYEYRDFLIFKDHQYMFWTISLLDHSVPPPDLRGNYTSKSIAQDAIDKFLKDERLKQEAADEARKANRTKEK